MVFKPRFIMHCAQDLITLFNRCFAKPFNTVLVGGGAEPIYRPSSAVCRTHTIVYTQDYFASALHEVAHWCVAGEKRRQLEDYGYWYAPDGRSHVQQTQFEQVEVVPQALEWQFSVAAGVRFGVSADNLCSALGPSDTFKQSIVKAAQGFCLTPLNDRAQADYAKNFFKYSIVFARCEYSFF